MDKLQLCLYFLKELKSGKYRSPKELCTKLGLNKDWFHMQVRYIKNNMDKIPMDVLTSFMKEYMDYYKQDFQDLESCNDLTKLFVDFMESEYSGKLQQIDDWEEYPLNESAEDFDGLKSLFEKHLHMKVLDVPTKNAEPSAVKNTVQEFIDAHQMGNVPLTNSSLWQSGENVRVSVKFDHKSARELSIEEYGKATDALIEKLSSRVPTWDWAVKHEVKSSDVGVICIHDAHFGKYCLPSISGDSYNLEIAKRRWNDAVEFHLGQFERNGVGKAYLIVGNDLFNTDNGKTTTAGTPQDEEGLYEATFAFVEQVVMASALRIAEKMPVEIITVAGNHDKMSIFYLSRVLQAYFANHPSIKVNSDGMGNMLRRYCIFGDTALCFTHGDKEKRGDLVSLIEYELEELFPTRRFKRKEVIVGHFHQEKGKDTLDTFRALTFRVMPSISGTDRWHKEMGYVGVKASGSLIYGEDHVIYLKHNAK